MQSVRVIIAVTLVAAGCARATTESALPSASRPPAAERTGDPALHAILDRVPLDSAAEQALQRYELEYPLTFVERVAAQAADPAASVAARYNAVQLLGERGAAAHVPELRAALEDPDPRVRVAAVVAAGRIRAQAGGNAGRSVLVAALADAAPEVQAKALEVLGPDEVALLRAFLARHTTGAAVPVARGLLQAAEDRAAPLAADSAGVLRRVTAGGITLEFRPTQRWPQWEAAVGTVSVAGGTSPAFTIPGVEAVAGVVPAFFSPDESALVYEQGRHVFVRQLGSGEVRDLGPGLAPRPLPFSEDFVFVRQAPGGGDLQQRTRINYDVLRTGFAPGSGDPRPIGKLGVFSESRQHGNYSPVRWMRVVERNTRFTLEGEGLDTFKLPDPFHQGSTP